MFLEGSSILTQFPFWFVSIRGQYVKNNNDANKLLYNGYPILNNLLIIISIPVTFIPLHQVNTLLINLLERYELVFYNN